jgi:hypothetical protein
MTNPRKEHGPQVTTDLSRVQWRTSTRSGGNGSCVEVADFDGAIAVRDSKGRQGPVLMCSPSQWTRFLVGLATK